LQVPLLADAKGEKPTADTAAGMVTYANVSKQYGVKYFSIGNEPDLYADHEPGYVSYVPGSYCAAVNAFVPAMKDIDPTLQIVGPDLAYKYQTPAPDWLTAILTECGANFDVVAVHYYEFDPSLATIANAMQGAAAFRATIQSLRQMMQAAGIGDKPLAITESNITYNGDPAVSTETASPATLPAGLWTADVLGVALEENLWTMALWSIREYWTLGLLTAQGERTPAYHAYKLYADHFGSNVLTVSATPSGVHAYASRNQANDATLVIVVNWRTDAEKLTFDLTGVAPVSPTLIFDPRTFSAVEIPDSGMPIVFSYGEVQQKARLPPEMKQAAGEE
jgi:Glycosyl hydrolase catalytic core